MKFRFFDLKSVNVKIRIMVTDHRAIENNILIMPNSKTPMPNEIFTPLDKIFAFFIHNQTPFCF